MSPKNYTWKNSRSRLSGRSTSAAPEIVSTVDVPELGGSAWVVPVLDADYRLDTATGIGWNSSAVSCLGSSRGMQVDADGAFSDGHLCSEPAPVSCCAPR